MSSSERLRMRLEASTKIISPRPIKDSSVLTNINRYKNTGRPTQTPSAGQQRSYSSEIVGAARAGCAICATPRSTTQTIDCCPIPADAVPKALALQGKIPGCCPYQGGPPPLPECCGTPGNVNTWWANDIPRGIVSPIPGCRACPPPEPEPCNCSKKRVNYKLIFMDCNMPVMDGFRAT
jgi:CheY-like chemotaxis protein